LLPIRRFEISVDNQTRVWSKSLPSESDFEQQRAAMVEEQLRCRNINNSRVLRSMQNVPRHEFVPKYLRSRAYADGPLAIGKGQTISQPYIVALMTQLANPESDSRVLDVGTGSGYQAAVLAEIVDHVDSIEIVDSLAEEARERLQRLGYENVDVRTGDGSLGLPEHAPYDVIIVAAAPDHVPQSLVDQLAPGGRLIIPVGQRVQKLTIVENNDDGLIEKTNVAPVTFVPMTGAAQPGRS
jgi:protein-L-isoaspartate(D-aspartate) O-methyltransferase